MNRATLATALLLAVAMPCAARADAAPEPGKGVGHIGCVRPIVPGTRWFGPPMLNYYHCRAEAARFQDGWCARTLSDRKDWPWTGPKATRLAALIEALSASYGHGC